MQKFAIFVRKSLNINILKTKNSVPQEIPIVLHHGSNYDYHFIIKELVKEFEEKFNYLGENTEKYINFSVPTEKAIKIIDRNGEEFTKNISYRLQFIGIARFMASLL